MELQKRLIGAGVDFDEFIGTHVGLELIPQIVDELVENLKASYKKIGIYKHDLKRQITPITDKTERYSRYFWKDVLKGNEKPADSYGDMAEEIAKAIIKFSKPGDYANEVNTKIYTEEDLKLAFRDGISMYATETCMTDKEAEEYIEVESNNWIEDFEKEREENSDSKENKSN